MSPAVELLDRPRVDRKAYSAPSRVRNDGLFPPRGKVFTLIESRMQDFPDIDPAVVAIFERRDVQHLLTPLRDHNLEWKIRHGGAVAGMVDAMNEAAEQEGLPHIDPVQGKTLHVVHDIGCGRIDDPQLINAPRRLTAEEFAVVAEHAFRGSQDVNHPVIKRGVRRHHSYADFANEPLTPYSEPIAVSEQILVASDIIQSMQDPWDRPYLVEAFPEDIVFAEVRKKVPHLPERIVEAGMRAGAVVLGIDHRMQMDELVRRTALHNLVLA